MIVVELSRFTGINSWENVQPSIYKTQVSAYTIAPYWAAFGSTEGSSTLRVLIQSVVYNFETLMTSQASVGDMVSQSGSFYYDYDAQVLYVHISAGQQIDPQFWEAGVVFGYTDEDVVYIDGIYYAPLVRSIPSLSQIADLINYDRMSFIAGTIEMDNTLGDFDDIIDDPIYGNDIFIKYLDSGKSDYTRAELLPLAALFVEDYSFSVTSLSLNVQDKRKALNADLLTERLPTGAPVPRATAYVFLAPGFVVNDSSYNVQYRFLQTDQGPSPIAFCEVLIDDVWTTVSPLAYDPLTATVTISGDSARASASAEPRAIRGSLYGEGLVDASWTISSIIKYFNESVFGIVYNSSNYDTTEFELESAKIADDVSVYISRQTKFYELIQLLQRTLRAGWRYEIKPDGRRSIRVDDWTRDQVAHVGIYDMRQPAQVVTDSSQLWAVYEVKGPRRIEPNTPIEPDIIDRSVEDEVFALYRQRPVITVDHSVLDTPSMQAKADYLIERLSRIRGVANFEALGKQWYELRIWDIITIDMSLESGRQFYGTWKAQVIGLDPDFQGLSTSVQAVLIERVI